MKIRMRKKGFCFALCLFLLLPTVIFGQQYSCTKFGLRNLKDFKLFVKDAKIVITPWNKVWDVSGFIVELVDFDDKWKFILNEGFPVYDVVFDAAENAYAGSDTCIYFSLDRGENWAILPAPKFHRIYEMFWSSDTALWIADSSRVWRLRLQGYQWQIALELEGKKSFAQTPEGIYLGVRGEGLYFLPWSSSTANSEPPFLWEYTDMVTVFPDLELANQIEDIAYNPRDSTLWIVSYGDDILNGLAGIFYQKDNQWQKLSDEGFPDVPGIMENFSVVAPYSNGAICFGGCYPRGLYILKPDGNWDLLTPYSGLLNSDIVSITPDPFHNNWVWVSHPSGGATLVIDYSTDVNDDTSPPKSFHLFQNYPNPFNPKTEIIYEISRPGRVEVSIYDINGRLVRKLVDRYEEAGRKSVIWDGRDASGRRVSSGVYIGRVRFGEEAKSIKMILQK